MTRTEIDRACGQSPCLCGDIDTWHPDCFSQKTEAEIKRGYVRAYRIARNELSARANQLVMQALAKAARKN